VTPEERAHAAADLAGLAKAGPVRRLSWLRIGAFVVLLIAGGAAVVGFRTASRSHPTQLPVSSFMPYVDVTATPQYPFEDAARAASANLVLGFVVGTPGHACAPSWGASYSLAQAATSMDLDRRIARLRQRGGQVAVSFGGEANSELAIDCTDQGKLAAAYLSVVDRYQLDTVDLDIEGDAASAPAVAQRRAAAIREVQLARTRTNHPLRVWLTLPVTPEGLTPQGRAVLTAMLDAKVELAGVNALTMDYGASLAPGQSLAAANRAALTALAGQLAAAWTAAGLPMSPSEAWQHLGATPMIGQNDVVAERFGLDDAQALLAFADSRHLRRLSMWSINRDQACGPNYANVSVVSPNCSGIDQKPSAFTKIFTAFTAGPAPVTPTPSASGAATAPAPMATAIVDDPATSPYPIWNPVMPYAQGTKIVWRHNVYLAKWWTQGDQPDAPVATASQTPWTLIGPVLPGEHPQPTPTMAAGTYPAWSGTATYVAGDRVLYQGVGYQAKWYNRGSVPGIVVADPGQTPWELITSAANQPTG
jgi:chitinase